MPLIDLIVVPYREEETMLRVLGSFAEGRKLEHPYVTIVKDTAVASFFGKWEARQDIFSAKTDDQVQCRLSLEAVRNSRAYLSAQHALGIILHHQGLNSLTRFGRLQ
jgi:hypothetical protein